MTSLLENITKPNISQNVYEVSEWSTKHVFRVVPELGRLHSITFCASVSRIAASLNVIPLSRRHALWTRVLRVDFERKVPTQPEPPRAPRVRTTSSGASSPSRAAVRSRIASIHTDPPPRHAADTRGELCEEFQPRGRQRAPDMQQPYALLPRGAG